MNASPASHHDSVPSKYAELHSRLAAYEAASSERRQRSKAEADELADYLFEGLGCSLAAAERPVEALSSDQFSARIATAAPPVSALPIVLPGSKKCSRSAKRPRKSRERDARNGRTLERLDTRRESGPGLASVAAPDTLPSPSITTSTSRRQKANARDKRLLPAWRFVGDVNRMKAMARRVQEIGAQAFSLNLSADTEAKALRDPGKAKTFMHDRLVKAFRRHFKFPVDFAFVLEFTRAGRLHLHGILVIDAAHKALATQALMEAGGEWDAAHPEFQSDIRKLWCGDGWANYCDKASSRTKAALGIKSDASLLSATQSLRRLGESYWESMRAAEKRERATKRAAQ